MVADWVLMVFLSSLCNSLLLESHFQFTCCPCNQVEDSIEEALIIVYPKIGMGFLIFAQQCES